MSALSVTVHMSGSAFPDYYVSHTHTITDCVDVHVRAGLLLRVGRGIEAEASVAFALQLRPAATNDKGEALVFGRRRAPRAPACGLWLHEVLYATPSPTDNQARRDGKRKAKRTRKDRKRRGSEQKESAGARRKKRRALVSACLKAVQPRETNANVAQSKPVNGNGNVAQSKPVNEKAPKPPSTNPAELARQRAEQARLQAAEIRQTRIQLQIQRDEARRAAIKALLRKASE